MHPRHASNSVPRHALDRSAAGTGTVGHEAARRIIAAPAPGRRTLPSISLRGALLRAVVVAVVAVFAGCLVYVVLPVPSAAAPGLVVAVPVTAAPRPPGLVGGLLDESDLVTAPEGVQTSAPDPSVDRPLIGWPVGDHTPSTGFGYRSDPFTHTQRWHDGVDLGQPCGDEVRASLAGTVSYAGWAGGYGNRIIVRHADRAGHAFSTTYNHLSWIGFGVGQEVDAGQVIAKVGSTGRSTACHLHFEVVLDGAYVDPMRFLTGDQSKAGLSRRVGSYMPSGLPEPSTTTRSPTQKATTSTPRATSASATPTPSQSTASPTPGTGSPTPGTGSPSPGTAAPTPTTASPTPSPDPDTPEAGTPAGGSASTTSGTPASPTGERSGPEPSAPSAPQTSAEGTA